MFRNLACLLIATGFALSSAAQKELFNSYVDSILKVKNIPGAAYAVLRSDTIISSGVFGQRRIDAPDPLTTKDFFHLGSNTKAITSLLAARLVDKGKIRWNTKVVELFPKWKDSIHKAHLLTSLADLLCHRAGILPFTSGAEYIPLPIEVKKSGRDGPTRLKFSKWLLQQAPINKDGAMVYSNAGYSIAAMMLEKVTGKTWERLLSEFMAEQRLKYFVGWPFRLSDKQPYGHWLAEDSLVAVTAEYRYELLSCIAPSGNVSMPIADYARFIQLMLREATGKNKLLKKETAEYMFYQIPDYSMGWGWQFRDGMHISFHDGSAGTFFAHTVMYKEADLAVIVIANSGEESAREGTHEIERRLSTDYWTIRPEENQLH